MKLATNLAAGAILGLAAFVLAKHIQESKDWKRSAELASKAIAQAKAHHLKETK